MDFIEHSGKLIIAAFVLIVLTPFMLIWGIIQPHRAEEIGHKFGNIIKAIRYF